MIQELTKEELHDAVDRIAEIYLTNFDDARSHKDMVANILKLSETPGFKAFISHQFGNINGYLYGYTSESNQFYRDLLNGYLTADESEKLNGAFEVLSLAVDKSHKHTGIGSKLLKALPAGKYYLTSDVHNIAANTFYYKNDWQLLKGNMHLHPNIPNKNLYYKEI
ncbi:hypothetical protein ACMGE7_01555 [Macrococcus equi]|uniref:hypothetical protein n=1 Tax=Macrococcus equi TaxID=3395462 RepID=UPI0039BE69F4